MRVINHFKQIRQIGYTLIELMVVVAIIALLTSVVFVSIQTMDVRRLESQANQLTSWLKMAQHQATFAGHGIGVVVADNHLEMVAPMDEQWFAIASVPRWQASSGLELELVESLDKSKQWQYSVDGELQPLDPQIPFLLMRPSGIIHAASNIRLSLRNEQLTISCDNEQTCQVLQP